MRLQISRLQGGANPIRRKVLPNRRLFLLFLFHFKAPFLVFLLVFASVSQIVSILSKKKTVQS